MSPDAELAGIEPGDHDAGMALALEQARAAIRLGEVPVGAVLVHGDGRVAARAFNRRELDGDPTAHAEMLVLRQATGLDKPGRWRLPPDCTLYVTLEPCVMCMGALVLARLPRLVFGAADPKGGAAETLYRIGEDDRLNHRVEVIGGVAAEEAGGLLTGFFRGLREGRRNGAG